MSKTGLVLLLIVLISCGDQRETERPVSPRIKKETKMVLPKRNQQFGLGESVSFEVKSNKQIDSVVLDSNGQQEIFRQATFTASANSERVGTHQFKVTVYFEGKSETHYPKVIFLPLDAPEEYTYEVVNTYPHNTGDYTQGLLFSNDFLYESTGQNGESTLQKKDITSGNALQQINLSNDYFGEGLALLNDQFFQLTYHAGACFVYNKDLEKINAFSYQGQGWGLTDYQGKLLMTNGSEKVFIRDPITFSVVDELQVYDNKGKRESLNELEVIEGLLYANIYLTDIIVAIDLTTGMVVKQIDMSGLLSKVESGSANVLNGIAYDPKTKRIFVTGKYWPKLFEVNFIPKKQVQ